jgi:hypothetical protein
MQLEELSFTTTHRWLKTKGWQKCQCCAFGYFKPGHEASNIIVAINMQLGEELDREDAN